MTNSPAELIAALDAKSTHFETPCGDGTMRWRRFGRGRPIVLLHGGSGSWKHWVCNIEYLAAAGHQVWAADMPGFGDSAEPHAPTDFVSMSRAIFDGIRIILPDDAPFDLTGFSLGSHTAQYVAELAGSRIRRLVLVNGHLVGDFIASPQTMLEKWTTITDPAERRAIFLRNLETLMFADAGNIDALALYIYEADLLRARTRPGRFIHGRDQLIIDRLRCPIRTIAGSLDPLGKPSAAAQAEQVRARQPTALTHLIEGAGHWVAYEAADRFNSALERALV